MKRVVLSIVLTLTCISGFSQEVQGVSAVQNEKKTAASAGNASGMEAKAAEAALALPVEELSAPKDSVTLKKYYSQSLDPRTLDNMMPLSYPGMTPFIRDYSNAGLIGIHGGVAVRAGSSYSEHPFLLTARGVSLGLSREFGDLGLVAGVSATHYGDMFNGGFYQYGISAQAEYRFTDGISIVGFAQFYNRTPFMSMAAYPFISTSRYGGYMSFTGDNVGIDVGVQRYYDPWGMQWEVAPIVTPKIRLWDNLTIGLPVGGAIKSGIDHMQMKKAHQEQLPPPPGPTGSVKHYGDRR